MSILLLETMTLPPIPVMAAIVRYSDVWIEARENYQKRSFRNRFYVSGPQGRKLITVPLKKGKNQQVPIRDVLISYDDNWPIQMLRHLKASYGSAPYFNYYYPDIATILSKRIWTTLFEFNHTLLEWVISSLNCQINLSFTENYESNYRNDVIDLRNQFMPTNEFFESYKSSERYQQVFENTTGFQANLSILDMLMCCGPETLKRLKDLTLWLPEP